MKQSIAHAGTVLALATILAISLSNKAAAGPVPTAPGQNKLQCFDGITSGGGSGGVCTLTSNGAKGPATLDNTVLIGPADFAGVYLENTTLTGQTFDKVTQLGFTYAGPVPKPGNLSLDLPVSIDGDDVNDLYLFIDAYHCAGFGGVVNVISDPNCGIAVDSPESAFYPNWAALVAAHPTWKVGGTGSASVSTLVFIVAERSSTAGPAFWTVSNVTLGKGGK